MTESFDLDEFQMELLSLEGKGYHCSQILFLLALRGMGRENPDLIRSMGGVALGLGHSNGTCGALLGGACLLGLYGGKGVDDEREHQAFRMMVRRLAEWFREEMATPEGSILCGDILEISGRTRCGLMVRSVWIKVLELLEENGIDPLEGRPLSE